MAKKDTLPEKKKKKSGEKTPKVVSGQKVQEGKVLPPEKAPSAYHLPLITRVMEIGLILVIVGTPLLFSIWSKNNFLLPKETYAESILIILLGIYLIKVVEEKKFNLVKSDIWYPLFAFLAITLISMVNTISLYLSLLDLAEFLSYFFVLFLTVNFIRTKVQRNRLFWALVAVCIISSTYAVCQFYNLEFKFWARQGGRGNIFSTFGNPNRYSGFVSACILPMIAYFLISKGWRKSLLGFAIPLTYTGVMMTFTRGAQMGLAVALLSMLIIVLLFFGRSFFKKFFYKIVYLVLVFGAITLIFSTENPINYTNLTLTERVTSAAGGQETSVRQRLMIWEISLLMAKDSPIIGKGVGTYKYHYLWYQGKYFENPENQDKINLAVWAREAHNEYVQILAEMGIIGIFCWMWLLFTFFRGRYRSLKEEKENLDAFLPRLGFTMGALVILVHATVSFPLHIVPNGILLFLLMGLASIPGGKLGYDKILQGKKEG